MYVKLLCYVSMYEKFEILKDRKKETFFSFQVELFRVAIEGAESWTSVLCRKGFEMDNFVLLLDRDKSYLI